MTTLSILPTILGVTLFLDEARDFPTLIVTGSRGALTKPIVRACHNLAGELGASIEFRA